MVGSRRQTSALSMARNTFRKADRLLTSREFSDAVRSGTAHRTRELTVHIRPNGLGRPRLGVSVGRRFSKRAPERSRMKRLVRESFRLNRERLPQADIVVVPRSDCGLDSLSQVTRALLKAVGGHGRPRRGLRDART